MPETIVPATSAGSSSSGVGSPKVGYTLSEMTERVREVLAPRSNSFESSLSLGNVRGLTFGQMKDRVRGVLRDDDGAFVTDTEIEDLLNEGLQEVAARSLSVRKRQTGTIAAGATDAPNDVIEMKSVFIEGVPAKIVDDDEEWWDWVNSGETPPRVLVRIFNQRMEFYPEPTGSSYELRYAAQPAILVSDGDMTEVPQLLQQKAIDYARSYAKTKMADFDAAQMYMARFDKDLAPIFGSTPREKEPAVGPREIQDWEIANFLNEFLLDAAARTETIRFEDSGTVTGDIAAIAIPDNYLKTITLRLGTDDNVEPVDDQSWYDWSDSTLTPSHSIARVFGEAIEVYPTPAANTEYVLRYVGRPTTLVEGSDKQELPIELQLRAINYARGHAKLIEGDKSMSDRYLGMALEGLAPSEPRQRFVPGPIQLVPQESVFESADYTRRGW